MSNQDTPEDIQPKSDPLRVKVGKTTLKLREGVNRVKTVTKDSAGVEHVKVTEYRQFTLAYTVGKQRFRRRFATLEEARAEAHLVATKLDGDEKKVLLLTEDDRLAYVQAKKHVEPLGVKVHAACEKYAAAVKALAGLPTKPSLEIAVNEYAAAVCRLPGDVELREAIDFYIARHPVGMRLRTVQQVVDELIEVKRKAGKSHVHLKDLESRLGKFAHAFECPIASVTQDWIQKWVDSLNLANRTKQNHLRLVRLLFGFAVRKGYLAREAVYEITGVEKPEAEETEIEIFAPDELRELFRHARPEMIPWLAVSAFAGIRNAELSRLDWRDVNLKSRYITVTAGKAKTGARRLVPITDTLFAWLQPHAQSSGPVVAFANIAKQIGWLVDDVNAARKKEGQPEFVWKHNGLRHSFCSYRLAVVKDAAKVALEAGNSPAMLFAHYRELVTEEQAKEWFAIMPAPETNILPMAVNTKLATANG